MRGENYNQNGNNSVLIAANPVKPRHLVTVICVDIGQKFIHFNSRTCTTKAFLNKVLLKT